MLLQWGAVRRHCPMRRRPSRSRRLRTPLRFLLRAGREFVISLHAFDPDKSRRYVELSVYEGEKCVLRVVVISRGESLAFLSADGIATQRVGDGRAARIQSSIRYVQRWAAVRYVRTEIRQNGAKRLVFVSGHAASLPLEADLFPKSDAIRLFGVLNKVTRLRGMMLSRYSNDASCRHDGGCRGRGQHSRSRRF
jgi:hypothetical protein